jgi:hypothetical protein
MTDAIELVRSLLARLFAPTSRRTKPRWPELLVLTLGLVLIPAWQSRLTGPELVAPPTYANAAATGIHYEPRFFFFLYHLGILPLVTDAPIRSDTKEEALRQIREEGRSLKVEEMGTFRSGDRGRVYLYYPWAWFEHDALQPHLLPGNLIGFSAALMAVWVAFWALGMSGLGAIAVLLLGSNPMMLFSMYKQDNVLGWPIAVAMIILGAHMPLLFDAYGHARKRWAWAIPIGTGIFIALMRTVRSEPTLMAASALLAYLAMGGVDWRRRLSFSFVFVGVLAVASAGSSRWMLHKFEVAERTMEQAGGEPYPGPRVLYHEIWHPIYCGLADYDTKYGYMWDDRVAYRYARPILLEKYGVRMPPIRPDAWGNSEEFWDPQHKYPIFVHEVPHYHDVIRDKVVSDILHDPKWYLGILGKRVERILKETTPLSVQIAKDAPLQSSSPLFGPLCVALAALLALTRRWSWLKLLVFTLPLSAPAFVIFSGKGMTYYSTYHIFGFVIFCRLVADGAHAWLTRPRRLATPSRA